MSDGGYCFARVALPGVPLCQGGRFYPDEMDVQANDIGNA